MSVADDIPLAGRGDLSALRRVRDYWVELALRAVEIPRLPRQDALAQVELLAELAAASQGRRGTAGLSSISGNCGAADLHS